MERRESWTPRGDWSACRESEPVATQRELCEKRAAGVRRTGVEAPGRAACAGARLGGGDLCLQLPLQGGHSAGGRRDTRAFQLPTHCGRGDSPAAGPRPAAPADPGGRQDRSGRGLVGGSLLWRQRAWGEETRCLGPGWNSRQLRSLGNLNLPRWGRPQLNMLQGWDWVRKGPKETDGKACSPGRRHDFPPLGPSLCTGTPRNRIPSVLFSFWGVLPLLARPGICRWAFQERFARRQRRADPLWDRYRF